MYLSCGKQEIAKIILCLVSALEGSSGCCVQDLSVEYGQFPLSSDKLSHQRKHTQSELNCNELSVLSRC